ncbi:signal peptide peptidase SppA [Treponema pedis]|uniref:signal peptide peptidase SppA n=1 Tax=Treponema pedis TaxID=409322 RepID=UPI0003FF11EA|nr:signal peptide peptidase SppA [Treponema pedis]
MDDNSTNQRKKGGFFRTLFRGINFIRLLIINIVFFLFFFSFMGIMGSVPSPQKKTFSRIIENTVLRVAPVGVAAETEGDFFPFTSIGLYKNSVVLISDLTKAIKNAAYDRRVTSLYLDFSELSGLSSGHLAELGGAISEFKKSGKKIYAYSVNYGISSFYLASYADRIGIDPLGEISFAGFKSRPVFYKGLEDKFGIKWNVLQAGKYKGMAETYSRENLSENVRSNLKSAFDALWNKYVSDISGNLNIAPEKIKNFAEHNFAIVKKYSGDTARAALEEGLVTDIASVDEFAVKIGFADGETFMSSVNTISYGDYNLNFTEIPSKNSVAVIYLNGAITGSSKNTQEAAVSSKLIELFDMAQDDPSVKAIVLRIDSGGGEVFASEEIRRAIERAKKSGLPVVVSMGSVAASGAYWISSSADYIFASPYTITGSIGVLGTAPSFQTALKKHLGITADLVYAGQKPGHSIFEDPSVEELDARQLEIMHIYETFIQTVSSGRNIPVETVADLAGGKIYSGEQALKLKLVDELGSFNDAASYAAKLANIQGGFSIKPVKKSLTLTQEVIKNFLNGADSSVLKQLGFADLYAAFEFLTLNSEKGIYLYMPERLIWEK